MLKVDLQAQVVEEELGSGVGEPSREQPIRSVIVAMATSIDTLAQFQRKVR
jgi:hypothetical protein